MLSRSDKQILSEFINEILENVIQTIDKNDFDVWVREFLKQQPEYIGK